MRRDRGEREKTEEGREDRRGESSLERERIEGTRERGRG